MGRHKINYPSEEEVEALRLKPEAIKKCRVKRKVKNCESCCRYEECIKGKKRDWFDKDVELLMGAVIFVALHDLLQKIPPLKKCKTRSQKLHREKMLYEKASAEVFFNSHLFKLTTLDLEYLKRTYLKYYENTKI